MTGLCFEVSFPKFSSLVDREASSSEAEATEGSVVTAVGVRGQGETSSQRSMPGEGAAPGAEGG
jgi:hypothetical protein